MRKFKIELSRLVASAVVNRRFCQTLLTNPAKAVDEGYCHETFDFTSTERELILLIRATTLEEFAAEVHQLTSESQDSG